MGNAIDTMPAYVEARIRRQPPAGCSVLLGSTPVVAFGDPRRSRVATLGLNPSRVEFEVGGVELTGRQRRFETLGSLGIQSLVEASHEQVHQVWRRCNDYVHGNPYQWFNRLEEQLQAVNASYFDDSACHLDLTQWATDPTWNKLPPVVRGQLIGVDREFLLTQLRAEPIELLLLNGRGVIDAFRAATEANLSAAGPPVADATVFTKIVTGWVNRVRVIGWSTNLQSSFGVTRELRKKLAERLKELAADGSGG